MKPVLLPFVREKWVGVSPPTQTLTNKVVIVTGANVGLGFEAALKFVALDAAKVVIGVRNILKGRDALNKIELQILRKGVVEVWQLDMDNFASIQAFANRASTELFQLDVVILNAGVSSKDYVLGPEGWESTLQVNVLGTALLALLLLPTLRASKRLHKEPSHLVIVTSEAHRWLEEKDFPTGSIGGNMLASVNTKPANAKDWDGMLQNARSKLFEMYITQGLASLSVAKNTGEPEVIVNSVCPGASKSDLMRDMKGPQYAVALSIFSLLFNKTTEQGARSYVHAATLDASHHGKWYKTNAITEPGFFVTSTRGQELQAQVWNEITSALKDKVAAVGAVLEGH